VPEGKDKLRIFDEKVKGFIAECRRSGLITFWFRYADNLGRQKEIKLGCHGDVTLEQARRRAQELRATTSLGADPVAEAARHRAIPSVAAFIEERYLPFAKERLRSFRDHEGFYRLQIKPRWGALRLDEVTPSHLVALQDALRGAGLSNATVNRYTAFVRRVFNLALRWQAYEGRNPAQHAEMRREQNRERFLTEDQLRALLQAINAEPNVVAAGVLALLAATGARRGEAMGARWQHIDLDRRLWTVPLSKSGRRRHIPLSDAACAILLRVRAAAPVASAWVFPGDDPAKRIGCIRKAWTRIKRGAGLPADLRIHDLRHAFASTLVGKGRSLHEVGQLLGHSQVSMTMRYAHLSPAKLIEAANLALPAAD
jgi:integrase